MGNRDRFNDADDSDDDFQERVADVIPDGEYPAIVVDFSVFTGKADDTVYVSWWFEVATGTCAGAEVQRFSNLDSPQGPKFVRKDLRRVTGRSVSYDDLYNEETGKTGPIKVEVLGARVLIKHRTKTVGPNTYRDVWIQSLLAPPDSSSQGSQSPQDEPEDDQSPQSNPHPSPPLPTADEDAGWGDPDCVVCEGTGCEECSPV